MPAAIRAKLCSCAEGKLGANLLLMHLIIEADDQLEVASVLQDALTEAQGAGDPTAIHNLEVALHLWRDTPDAFATVKSVLAAERAGRAGLESGSGTTAWAAAFDNAASISPEASVALYSLGRKDLLEAATQELVELLRSWSLLGPESRILEIGCGIGRFLPLLSAAGKGVLGLDISPKMVEQARDRTRHLPNVTVEFSKGGLAPVSDQRFDLILAVDAFPYIVEAGSGLAARHLSDAARMLSTRGALAIFNYSYRGDEERDRAELAELAESSGLIVTRNGIRPLKLWDGLCFELRLK